MAERPSRQASPPPYPAPGWSTPNEGPWVWALADEDWKAGGLDRPCRARDCGKPAVLRLNRWQHRRGKGRVPMWWFYCAEHAYCRVVHDGAVWESHRPKDWDGTYEPAPNDQEQAR